METKELTCIGCPLGCAITVTLEEKEVVTVTGNTCKRGDAYARKELTHPTRTITSTVRVENGVIPMVSVKTKGEIGKDKIFDCMKAIHGVKVKAPVKIGDVILDNAANTGISIVATKNVEAL